MQLKFTEANVLAFAPPKAPATQAYYWDDVTQSKDKKAVHGLGVVVGKTGIRTFVYRGWVAGKNLREKVTIGIVGRALDSGRRLNLLEARKEAGEIAVDHKNGISRNATKQADKVARDGALTLRAALTLYVNELRDNHKSERSIETVEYDVPRLLSRWLDKPLADLTVEAVQGIKERGRKHKTTTNRLLAELSAIWNVARRLRRSTFTAENPIGLTAVRRYQLKGEDAPSRERVNNEDLAEWYRRVCMLSSLRRDLQLVTLFTGLRDANVTTMRWVDLNLTDEPVRVPGLDKPLEPLTFAAPRSKTTPFRIPLGPTVVELLRKRREENAVLFPKGDGGLVFPSWSRDTKRGARNKSSRVVPTAETKERRPDTMGRPWRELHDESYKPTGARVLFVPGLHDLRRTFTSIADDLDISDRTQHQLTNHKPRTVHDLYTIKSIETLRAATERIDAELWKHLTPSAK